ncbi:ankyrin repeat-containing domain protein [Aspergillus filifer]
MPDNTTSPENPQSASHTTNDVENGRPTQRTSAMEALERLHTHTPELRLRANEFVAPAEQILFLRRHPSFDILWNNDQFKSLDDRGRNIVNHLAERILPESLPNLKQLRLSMFPIANDQDNNKRTPIMYALESHNWPKYKFLLKEHPEGISLAEARGDTLLHLATMFRLTNNVQILLRHDSIKVNLRDKLGRTPLLEAVFQQEYETTKALLAHPKVSMAVPGNARKIQALSVAAECGNKAPVELLLQHKGVKVNVVDNTGLTPLTNVISFDYREIRDLLLEVEKMNVNFPSGRYDSPPVVACSQHRWDSLTALCDRDDLDIDARDNYGWSALLWAAHEENNEGFMMFLIYGADPVLKDPDNQNGPDILTKVYDKSYLGMVDRFRDAEYEL